MQHWKNCLSLYSSKENRRVLWLFRKKRPLGNYSIENSFAEMHAEWKGISNPTFKEISTFSEGLLNRLRIIGEAKSLKTDLVHITGDIHFAALAWPKWRRNRPKVVLTIHDIGFLNDHKGIKRWLMRKVWILWPLRCIDHLVTVSEATKQAVLKEATWFDPTKITVIPTVVPQHFKPRKKQPSNPKPIALHIGLAENKNLKRHAEALDGLDVHLKIIGEPSPQDLALLERHNIDFSWQSKLTDEEMQEAYATSDFLLFSSTLEGFGMPIIEAQMVGLPVITSDSDPMREVAGDAALLCDPFDTNSIRASIEEVIGNLEKREDLIQKGFVNCNRYAPATSAAMLNELYERLLNP